MNTFSDQLTFSNATVPVTDPAWGGGVARGVGIKKGNILYSRYRVKCYRISSRIFFQTYPETSSVTNVPQLLHLEYRIITGRNEVGPR